jgi:NADPH:quinone reductase
MRAVVLTEFGPPGQLALAELPDPVAGPGQVVISVGFAGVTFVETQIRSGHPPHPSMAPVLPVVLGNGAGGTATTAGAGVQPGLLGGQFVTTTGGSGGSAELAAVAADELIPVPAGMPLDHAVALLADGRTAMALMQSASVAPGETVIVEAAAGGVGSLLVQLARNAGATVVAAAGGPRKVEVAAGLGAAITVDYREQGWPEKLMAAVGPVDVVFDGVGGAIGAAAFSLLRDGGRMCMFGMASGSFTPVPADDAAARGITVLRGVPVTPARARELTATALDAAAAGALRPLIGQRFELADAAIAHAAIETRSTIGKTLLTVS